MQEHFLSLDKAVVIDTETTGINPQIDRIVSLSALKVDFSTLTLTPDGLLQLSYEKFGELVDPEKRIPREATAIHGISDADVVGRRTFRQLAPDFLAFVGDLPLVAHNMKFDGRFLDAELGRCGKPLPTNQLRLQTH
ncbi:MAG: exonuclease domain-containing protein [Pseudomonadota bacterium]